MAGDRICETGIEQWRNIKDTYTGLEGGREREVLGYFYLFSESKELLSELDSRLKSFILALGCRSDCHVIARLSTGLV